MNVCLAARDMVSFNPSEHICTVQPKLVDATTNDRPSWATGAMWVFVLLGAM